MSAKRVVLFVTCAITAVGAGCTTDDSGVDIESALADDTLYEMTVECLMRITGDDLSDVDASSSSQLDELIAEYGLTYHNCLDDSVELLTGNN